MGIFLLRKGAYDFQQSHPPSNLVLFQGVPVNPECNIWGGLLWSAVRGEIGGDYCFTSRTLLIVGEHKPKGNPSAFLLYSVIHITSGCHLAVPPEYWKYPYKECMFNTLFSSSVVSLMKRKADVFSSKSFPVWIIATGTW